MGKVVGNSSAQGWLSGQWIGWLITVKLWCGGGSYDSDQTTFWVNCNQLLFIETNDHSLINPGSNQNLEAV